MKIGLYADNTVALPVQALCDQLNLLCTSIQFSAGKTRVRLPSVVISSPTTGEELPPAVRAEVKQFDLACIATSVPYDNNHFFHTSDGAVVLSFSGWNLLTDLPLTNGFVYFVASIVADELGIGSTHEENTGCVNDFWWDKRGVDVGMRAAFICGDCLSASPVDERTQGYVADVQALLDAVSSASRAGADILSAESPKPSVDASRFDIFLCHNSDDKPAVRKVNDAMKASGLKTWLDEEQLPLGVPWLPELEKQIKDVRSAAVFVGEKGEGPWQRVEIFGLLAEFVSRNCPVVPVLLPDAPGIPDVPIFLSQMTWIDLRQDYGGQLKRLIGFLEARRFSDSWENSP